MRIWRGPRGQLNLSLSGTGVVYREERAADHVDGTANLNWSQRLSAKVRFSLAGFGSYASTTSQQILTDTGIVLPRAQSRSYGGSNGFDFRLGPRASLRLSGRYDRVRFDDPTLVGSQSAAGEATLARRLGRRDEISLSYGFLRTKDETRDPLDSHYGVLGWTRTVSHHFSLSLAGGAGYNPETMGGIDRQWYFHGTGSLQGRWRRATLLARVRQSVTPAYGLGGNQISDTASLSATVPFGRQVQLSIMGNRTWGRFRSGAQPGYVSDDASLSLGVRLFRYAGLEMGYGYRRNDPEDALPAVDGHRGFLGFTYSRP